MTTNSMTDEQVKKVYDTLEKESENSNADKLKDAAAETDNSNYGKIVEMKNTGLGLDSNITECDEDTFNPDLINETESSYTEIFQSYDISDEDGAKLFEIIRRYKAGEEFDLYNEMPDRIKPTIDSMRFTSEGKVSKNSAAKFLLDSFINDAKFNAAVEEYNTEINNLMIDSNREFQYLAQDTINEMLSRIDDIRKENPEKADQIEAIKKAFDDSKSFNRQLDYLDHISAKKLNKLLDRYDNECFYFNKKVNKTDVKIPDIKKIAPIIKKALPGFTEKQTKLFSIVLMKSVENMDTENIVDLAYIYRLVSNIATFEFNTDFKSEYAKELFGNIAPVIQKIINL